LLAQQDPGADSLKTWWIILIPLFRLDHLKINKKLDYHKKIMVKIAIKFPKSIWP
jgi:hypothetical protein